MEEPKLKITYTAKSVSGTRHHDLLFSIICLLFQFVSFEFIREEQWPIEMIQNSCNFIFGEPPLKFKFRFIFRGFNILDHGVDLLSLF